MAPYNIDYLLSYCIEQRNTIILELTNLKSNIIKQIGKMEFDNCIEYEKIMVHTKSMIKNIDDEIDYLEKVTFD